MITPPMRLHGYEIICGKNMKIIEIIEICDKKCKTYRKMFEFLA
jgi:hypothetical protein